MNVIYIGNANMGGGTWRDRPQAGRLSCHGRLSGDAVCVDR